MTLTIALLHVIDHFSNREAGWRGATMPLYRGPSILLIILTLSKLPLADAGFLGLPLVWPWNDIGRWYFEMILM